MIFLLILYPFSLIVHTAEIRNDAETEAILKLAPHRIGHGTFISPLLTESTRLLELLKESNIPVGKLKVEVEQCVIRRTKT